MQVAQRNFMEKVRRTVRIYSSMRWRAGYQLSIWIMALMAVSLCAQDTKQPAAAPAAPQPTAPSTSVPMPPVQLDGEAALHHLNEVISWYRHSTTEIRSVGLPSDAIYQDNAQ